MAVPAPPMSRATSSQHPATTASATADGAVAGGDALPGDDDAPGAPRQEAEEAVVEATDRAEGVLMPAEMQGQMSHQYDELYSCQMELNTRREAHEKRSASEKMAAETAAPASRAATERAAFGDGRQPPAGHADLLVAMLTGALRAVAGGGHMHYHVRVLAGRPSCVDCGQRTDWECCCDGTPALCGPKYPCMATHQRTVPCPTTATVRAEFRHVRDAFHDATRAAVCEASEKARAAGRVRRVRRRTAQELKESETCRQ
eukprot:jgi/Tetstr1/455866/TSEL_042655.t1